MGIGVYSGEGARGNGRWGIICCGAIMSSMFLKLY
jgi:hypothetical protein